MQILSVPSLSLVPTLHSQQAVAWLLFSVCQSYQSWRIITKAVCWFDASSKPRWELLYSETGDNLAQRIAIHNQPTVAFCSRWSWRSFCKTYECSVFCNTSSRTVFMAQCTWLDAVSLWMLNASHINVRDKKQNLSALLAARLYCIVWQSCTAVISLVITPPLEYQQNPLQASLE